jgi:acetoin utilization deacetylase AcuC-like enzyme
MFHSTDYIEALKRYSNKNEDEERIMMSDKENNQDFGIGYDCPFIEDMLKFCCTLAGASITCAHLINTRQFKYAINWFGKII